MCDNKVSSILHVAFYPWFGLSHLNSFLRLANQFAERGHKVSFFLPSQTQPKLAPQNHFPNHLTFIPITVPSVNGLPLGSETADNVPVSAHTLIMTAMDLTRDTIEAHLAQLKPKFVFYDLASWIPELGRKHGFKSVHYITAYMAKYAYLAPTLKSGRNPTFTHLAIPPSGFPGPYIRMKGHEANIVAGTTKDPFGLGNLTLVQRIGLSFRECNAIVAKTCLEMEGEFCEFVENVFDKPVLVAGPMVPDKPICTKLDQHLDDWLKGFGASNVIYCAFGNECVLELNQFQELLLGLELTGRPFLAALNPPMNCKTLESALPQGFAHRTRGRVIIHEDWVQQQQQLILQHPSLGCFITDCGETCLSEAIITKCQVVLMPLAIDQYINARMMSLEWNIGVEVEKRLSDGFFTKEAVFEAVSLVMEEETEVAREVKANHALWRQVVTKKGLEDSYVNRFIENLQRLFG